MLHILDVDQLGYETLVLPASLGVADPVVSSCSSCAIYSPSPQLSGNLQVDPEIHLPSPGMDVDIAYFYNSTSRYNGPFGYGRTLSINLTAQASGTPVIVSLTRGNGAIVTYQDDGLGQYVSYTPEVVNSLVRDDASGYWKETTPGGQLMAYPLNIEGHVTTIAYVADAAGDCHTFSYSEGQLRTLQETLGRVVSFSYNDDDLLKSITDWGGRITSFSYDTALVEGKPALTTVTGPTGCQTGYGYSIHHGAPRLNQVTDPNGYATTYAYDGSGRIAQRTLAGAITQYHYLSKKTVMISPTGGALTHTFDDNWRIIELEDASGVTTRIRRNEKSQEIARINGLGAISSITYDESGLPLSNIDPLGHTTTFLRDVFGNATTTIYADGTMSESIYGYAGSPFDSTGVKQQVQVEVDALGHRTSYSYNSRGQLTAMQNPLGYITSYGYDVYGNQITETNALDQVTTMAYDVVGNMIASTDPLGHTTSVTYDAQNRPLTVMDALGNVNTTAYDSVGNVVVRIDPLGRRTSYTYDAFNMQVEIIDMLGNRATSIYDNNGQQIATIDPLGYRTSIVYDLAGKVIATQNALGYLTTMVYDLAGRNIATIDALGYHTTTIYDIANRIVGSMDAEGYISTTVYNSMNRPVANVDALGRVTSRIYDADGRMTTYIDPVGYCNTSVYDANNQLIANIDSLGHISSATYDALGRNIATIDALGYRSTMVYDAAGRTIAGINARGFVASSSYDAANRVISTQDARGYVSSFVYDAAGQQISLQDALGSLSTVIYDSLGRQQTMIDPLGHQSTFIYDAVSQTIATIDANGNCTTSVYDGNGQQIAQINALGNTASLIYDAVGQTVAVVDARGNRTTSVYDARRSLIASADPLNRRTSYTYDAVANQILRLDARGIATTYSYDPRDLLIGVQYPDGGLITNSYDAVDRQTVMADSTGTTTYAYDADDRPISVAYPVGKVLSYSYDGVSNRIQMQLDAGVTSYSYDPNDNVVQIINPYNETTTFSYDALNREVQKTLANGIAIDHTYDAVGRILLLEQHKADSTPLAIYTATYDAVDMRTSTLELDGSSVSYSYDVTYQLTNETRSGSHAFSTTFTYDAADNRLVQNADGILTTSTYDAANQLTTATTGRDTTTFSYDANGNRTTENAQGGVTTFTWDEENRMASVNDDTNTETVSYAGNGERRSKSTFGEDVNYLWDGTNVLEELDGSNNLLAHYTEFPGYWGGLSSERLAGDDSAFYLFDLQSSNRLLLDTTEAIVDQYLYTVFGEKVLSTGNTRNLRQFQGEVGAFLDSLNNSWIQARIYDYRTATWISTDPSAIAGNLYQFNYNNPINFVDPDGENPIDISHMIYLKNGKPMYPRIPINGGTRSNSRNYYPVKRDCHSQQSGWNGLLQDTQDKIMSCLAFIGIPSCIKPSGICNLPSAPYSVTNPTGPYPPGRNFKNRIRYYINQSYGYDPASANSHCPDAKVGGKPYSAAVDIGVVGNTFGAPKGNVNHDLNLLERQLRSCGLPAFHRIGTGNSKNHYNDSENEIHLIDPRVPHMKDYLHKQIYYKYIANAPIKPIQNYGYLAGGAGKAKYRWRPITKSERQAFINLMKEPNTKVMQKMRVTDEYKEGQGC